jgi:predicted dehydrogenase
LQTTAVAGVGYWAAASVRAQSNSPNEQIRFACIGVDGKGSSDSGDAARHGEIVAICDIDDQKLDAASKREKFAKAKRYNDYRKMLDEMRDQIDAVTVSTPDHSHAPASAMAMRLGKHCFCQKPLTHDIWEARRLGEIAREMKVATMMGNQGTAENGVRKASAIVQAGTLGAVTEVHIWTNRPIWAQGGPRPEPVAVPEYVHWDLFLGPAPERPYARGYHPFAWRGWWDFGTGALGDMACHTVNMPFMALNLRDPISVAAETSGHNQDSYPKWSRIRFEFPELSGRAPVVMYWYDGGERPEPSIFLSGKFPTSTDREGNPRIHESGALLIGEKGHLFSGGDYGERYELHGNVTEPEKVEFERSPGHFEEWVREMRGGPRATSNFPDYAGPLTETILLGNLAVWCGEKVDWDAATLTPTNKPELAAIVRRTYRQGYEV